MEISKKSIILLENEQALSVQLMGGETAVVIRSSATDEDSVAVSFAGQYATIFCSKKDMLEQGIRDCWRSFFTANALAHRAQTGQPLPDASIGVLIQPLIDADCAGVAYSVDPVNQVRTQVVVNSVWGLGPGVVEWALADNHVWILQSRPLTSLPPKLQQTSPFPISWHNNDHTYFWQRADYKAHQQEVPLLQTALAAQRHHAMIHPLCAWRPRSAYHDAYTAVTGQSGSDAEAAAIKLLDGEDTPLTRLIDALYTLGRTALAHPVLIEIVSNPPSGSIKTLLKRLDALGADTAATAREYGITAVIATGNATQRIPDGAPIFVDGTNGIVRLQQDQAMGRF